MRLKDLIPTFILSLAIISVDAIQRPQKSRLAQHSVVSQRQYHPQRVSARDLIDICVNLDAIIGGDQLLEQIFTGAHVCLCLKDLDIFLDTYVILDLLGLRATVAAELNNILGAQPPCPALPAHAHRTCTTADPCHYTCDDSFTEIGGQCVCAPPKSICNGVCGNFPHGCTGYPSSLPRSLKKRAAQEITFADAQAYCGEKRVCGIPNASDDYAFECIDIRTSSESCGGCVTAHPWARSTLSGRGLDCTALQSRGVAHRCENGECVADPCPPGADGCVPSSRIFPRLDVPALVPSNFPGSRSVPLAPGPVVLSSTSTSSLSAAISPCVSTNPSDTTSVTDTSSVVDDGSINALTDSLGDTVSSPIALGDLADGVDAGNPSDPTGSLIDSGTLVNLTDGLDLGTPIYSTSSLTDGLNPELDGLTASLDSLSSNGSPSGFTDGLGLNSSVSSSVSPSGEADCDCDDSSPPPPPDCPSSWPSSSSGLLDGILKSLRIRKRHENPCEGAPPPPVPPASVPSSTEPCDEPASSGASKPVKSGVAASGSDIVVNLEPLAVAGVDIS